MGRGLAFAILKKANRVDRPAQPGRLHQGLGVNWSARFGNSPIVAASRLTILCLSLFLFAYVAVRAARLAFTYDEATTYLDTIASGPLAAFTFDSANNHFLNSLLTKLVSLAGSSEFILRLPNLLAFAVYLFFSFLILDRFIKRPAIRLAGFILLVANPYTLDFFSLCRGYGLSLAFLMASLYYFFAFQERATRREPGGYRNLRYSLAAASLAVLSNFTLLDAYLGLCAIAFGLCVFFNVAVRREGTPQGSEGGSGSRPVRVRAALVVGLIVFNSILILHDARLMGPLYRPVGVDIPGLGEPEREEISVIGLGWKKSIIRFERDGDHWFALAPGYVEAIRLRAPADIWKKIGSVEIGEGAVTYKLPRAFLKRALRLQRNETSVVFTNANIPLGRSILPGFRRAINWSGDLALLRVFLLRLLLLSAIGGFAAALTGGAASVLLRRKLLTSEQFWLVAGSVLTVAALVGYPLYALRRNGELYWGGGSGFIRDTVSSLIRYSFYGRTYFRGQDLVVLALVSAIVLAFVIVFVVALRRGQGINVLPGLTLLSLLAMTWALTAIEHVIFHEPYLLGRTGLFCLPIFALFLIFFVRHLSQSGSRAGPVAVAALLVLACASVGHFIRCLNTSVTEEWRMDADVKRMLRDLEILKNQEYGFRSGPSLGVEWFYTAPLRYYQRRKEFAWLTVRSAPPPEGFDFFFTQASRLPQHIPPRLTLLKSYPSSGAVLAKLDAP